MKKSVFFALFTVVLFAGCAVQPARIVYVTAPAQPAVAAKPNCVPFNGKQLCDTVPPAPAAQPPVVYAPPAPAYYPAPMYYPYPYYYGPALGFSMRFGGRGGHFGFGFR